MIPALVECYALKRPRACTIGTHGTTLQYMGWLRLRVACRGPYEVQQFLRVAQTIAYSCTMSVRGLRDA